MGTTLTSRQVEPSSLSPEEVPIEQLELTIWQGAANLTAAEHDWLRAVAAFDRRRGWERWEMPSCAHWLNWQVSLALGAAREKVRVAHALDEFPLIAAAMADGTLSYSKVRAITRIATPATEQALVDLALAGTTNQVERMVSARRRAQPGDDEQDRRQWDGRGLWHRTRDDGTVAITLVLPPLEATAFLSAAEQYAPDAEPGVDGTFEPRAARRADGAVGMAHAAHAAMAQTLSAPNYLVTLHADLDAILDDGDEDDDGDVSQETRDDVPQETCDCQDHRPDVSHETRHDVSQETRDDVSQETSGRPNRAQRRWMARLERRREVEGHGDAVELPIGVSRNTALRMLCDADVEALIRKSDISGMTDRSSVITGKLRRLVLARDRCCQFPGCSRRAGVQVHHLHERANDGNNELANLAVLCHYHHRRVHEGGWKAHRDPAGRLVFVAPDGRIITQAAPNVPGDAGQVTAKGRTADDGRSQWAGDRLDLGLANLSLDSMERNHHNRWQPKTP